MRLSLPAVLLAAALLHAEPAPETPRDTKLESITREEGSMTAAAFSADNSSVAGCLDNGEILRIWASGNGAPARSFEVKGRASSPPAFSPDGRLVAVGTNEHEVFVWEVESGKTVLHGKGHGYAVQSVAFSPDGKQLASVAWSDTLLKLWDVEKGTETASFKVDGGWKSVAWIAEGKRLLLAGGDVAVYEAASGKRLQHLEHGAQGCASLSPDGTTIATGTWGIQMVARDDGGRGCESHNEGLLWNAETAAPAGVLEADAQASEPPTIIAWSGDSSRIVVQRDPYGLEVYAAGKSPARIWKQPKGELVAICAISVAEDGSFVMLALRDGTIRTWKLPGK